MIKINLLTTEKKVAKKAVAFDPSQQIVAVCGLVLIIAGLAIGWRYSLVSRDAAQMDQAILIEEKETARLHSVIVQVQQFEQRKAQLQQRVTLIEQLRKEQIGPVHMLDQISNALPPSLWLTEMKQTATPNEVLLDGRSLSLTGLSDFVANLEHSGYFQRGIEIVNSATDISGGPETEVVKFQIKALFKVPGDSNASTTADANSASGQLKPKG